MSPYSAGKGIQDSRVRRGPTAQDTAHRMRQHRSDGCHPPACTLVVPRSLSSTARPRSRWPLRHRSRAAGQALIQFQRRRQALAAAPPPHLSIRELGDSGSRMPPASRMNAGTAARPRLSRQPWLQSCTPEQVGEVGGAGRPAWVRPCSLPPRADSCDYRAGGQRTVVDQLRH